MVDEVRAALSRLVAATLRRQAASFDVDYDCRDDANYALGNALTEARRVLTANPEVKA